MIDNSIRYLDYIANNYSEIKNNIGKESLKRFGEVVDEDIFHDTIIKCIKATNKLDLNKEQFINYIFISYKTNYLRELEYVRNKNREDIDVNTINQLDYDSNFIDYNKIKQIIIDKFGDNEWELFESYIYGSSISDITKYSCEKGLYYRFNKIKNYAKQFICK